MCISIINFCFHAFSFFIVAVDMWSAGVIMLCMLSRRYPFFKAKDDMESLAQIVTMFGAPSVKRMAKTIGKWCASSLFSGFFSPKIDVFQLALLHGETDTYDHSLMGRQTSNFMERQIPMTIL